MHIIEWFNPYLKQKVVIRISDPLIELSFFKIKDPINKIIVGIPIIIINSENPKINPDNKLVYIFLI